MENLYQSRKYRNSTIFHYLIEVDRFEDFYYIYGIHNMFHHATASLDVLK